jgi:GH18 family chitinase
MFVTYDDVSSVAEKVKFVKSNSIGGMMAWELSGDVRNDNARSLLNAIYQGLNQ